MARNILRVLVFLLPTCVLLLLGSKVFGFNVASSSEELFAVFALYALGIMFTFFPNAVREFNKDMGPNDEDDGLGRHTVEHYRTIGRVIGVSAILFGTAVLVGSLLK